MMQRLKMYWGYFKYVIEHKWNVGLECLRLSMIIHAITHDLSKFSPSEFFAYAHKFYGGDYAYKYFEIENGFSRAWLLHQHRNKHHWDYWVRSDNKPVPMPDKYIAQMLCDWRGMSRKFGDTATEFYEKNKNKMILHSETIEIIRLHLSVKK